MESITLLAVLNEDLSVKPPPNFITKYHVGLRLDLGSPIVLLKGSFLLGFGRYMSDAEIEIFQRWLQSKLVKHSISRILSRGIGEDRISNLRYPKQYTLESL